MKLFHDARIRIAAIIQNEAKKIQNNAKNIMANIQESMAICTTQDKTKKKINNTIKIMVKGQVTRFNRTNHMNRKSQQILNIRKPVSPKIIPITETVLKDTKHENKSTVKILKN